LLFEKRELERIYEIRGKDRSALARRLNLSPEVPEIEACAPFGRDERGSELLDPVCVFANFFAMRGQRADYNAMNVRLNVSFIRFAIGS
jgi:hypothetical protein